MQILEMMREKRALLRRLSALYGRLGYSETKLQIQFESYQQDIEIQKRKRAKLASEGKSERKQSDVQLPE
jgi:hypothetical protein